MFGIFFRAAAILVFKIAHFSSIQLWYVWCVYWTCMLNPNGVWGFFSFQFRMLAVGTSGLLQTHAHTTYLFAEYGLCACALRHCVGSLLTVLIHFFFFFHLPPFCVLWLQWYCVRKYSCDDWKIKETNKKKNSNCKCKCLCVYSIYSLHIRCLFVREFIWASFMLWKIHIEYMMDDVAIIKIFKSNENWMSKCIEMHSREIIL